VSIPKRLRLTKLQELQICRRKRKHPDWNHRKLGVWSQKEFGLPRAPSSIINTSGNLSNSSRMCLVCSVMHVAIVYHEKKRKVNITAKCRVVAIKSYLFPNVSTNIRPMFPGSEANSIIH
jgi:hypothetical protein